MNLLLENRINDILLNIFKQLDLDEKFAFVKVSDRPDLSDFQCNGALALAKIAHKNPREIGSMIAEELQKIGKVASGNIFVDAEGKLKQDGSFSFIKAERFVQNALASPNMQSAILKNVIKHTK